MRGSFPRDILNELKWHPEKSLNGVVVKYLHRGALARAKRKRRATASAQQAGAPEDLAVVKGEEIVKLDKAFFVIKRREEEQETWIPYHRIREIKSGEEILWKKRTIKKQ